MDDNPYAGYMYKRPSKNGATGKHGVARFLTFLIIASGILVVVFVANLFLGFWGFGSKKARAVLPAACVYVVEVDSFTGKAAALNRSYQIKKQGGAGYLRQREGSWRVIEGGYSTIEEAELAVSLALETGVINNPVVREVKVKEREVQLINASHAKLFEKIIKSFIENFDTFSNLLREYRAGDKSSVEISVEALREYNDLSATVVSFDKIQNNAQDPFYARVLLAANRQLLALYLLSAEASNANFTTELSGCVCNIVFSYVDLVECVL